MSDNQIRQFLKDLSKHSDAVKRCTRPLRHLGITCFYYLSIKDNGEHVLVTDHPEVADYYYDQKLYANDPYLRHPNNYKSGFFSIDTSHKEEFDASLVYIVRNFKMVPLIGLCERAKDSVEFFGFWGEIDAIQIATKYTPLLQAFATHFKKECKSIIQPETGPSLCLRELLGAKQFDTVNTLQHQEEAKLIRKYLIEIGYEEHVTKADSLSQREKECIRLLLKGKAMKETASILHLSPRTIEHYINSAKSKLDYSYKNELFTFAEELAEFGLL